MNDMTKAAQRTLAAGTAPGKIVDQMLVDGLSTEQKIILSWVQMIDTQVAILTPNDSALILRGPEFMGDNTVYLINLADGAVIKEFVIGSKGYAKLVTAIRINPTV